MGFLSSLLRNLGISHAKSIDWEELEAALYQSDLGSETTASILTRLQEKKGSLSTTTILEAARKEIATFLPQITPPLIPSNKGPVVIFLVGVNGTGKTTSAAKLAYYLKHRGHSVLLAAADTFRAAAIEQLATWGERLGIEVIKSHYGADAAALCHDALSKAIRLRHDFLICDTAGRLHTKSNLMEELAKIKRTVAKLDPSAPHHVLLVVDTTTGTNGLNQAKEFHAAVKLTGLIITKIDGSGKGGLAAAIAREIGIYPLFLGSGEQASDFTPFDRDVFLERLI